ncbi:MAG TPA: hypothetical protein VHH73_16580, partial [Verrucomicrobiae bacterium]|nr:hypothetical protein [Verrucomicrobiae bacterium]
KRSAKSLGLSLQPWQTNVSGVPMWISPETPVDLHFSFFRHSALKGQLVSIDLPPYFDRVGAEAPPIAHVAGLMGWGAIRDNILRLDAEKGQFEILREVPAEALGWTRLLLVTNSSVLALAAENSPDEWIYLDSGAQNGGVDLSPRYWREWKAAGTNRQIFLAGAWTPALGIYAQEAAWAGRVPVGPLVLTDVSVETSRRRFMPATNGIATLGYAALKRLDLIVDGLQNVAYVRPKTTAAKKPKALENDRSALFLPRGPDSDDLVAQVLEDGTAFHAGIRDGDVLVSLDGQDVRGWRTNAKLRRESRGVLLVRAAKSRPDARVDLVLRREGEIIGLHVPERSIQVIAPLMELAKPAR